MRLLLEFAAGYALLVDACEDGATVDQLKMAHLGVPLLEAEQVVQELINLVRPATGLRRDTLEPGAAWRRRRSRVQTERDEKRGVMKAEPCRAWPKRLPGRRGKALSTSRRSNADDRPYIALSTAPWPLTAPTPGDAYQPAIEEVAIVNLKLEVDEKVMLPTLRLMAPKVADGGPCGRHQCRLGQALRPPRREELLNR